MSTTLDNLTRDEDAYVAMIEEKKVSQSKKAFMPVCVSVCMCLVGYLLIFAQCYSVSVIISDAAL